MAYQYDDLPTPSSFRIVELLAGEGHQQISCSLHTVDWSTSQEYEAVSYTWGDPSDTSSVYCHGKLHKVTTSLYVALQQLRYPKQSRYLWADALCTNQLNIPERGNQVNQMREIYQKASRVLIWLGPDTTDFKARKAIKLIDQIASYICERVGYTLSDIHRVDDVYQKVVLRAQDKLPHPDKCDHITDDSWEALHWFYSHRYFSRAWVIQEINANDQRLVHCGSETIKWDCVHLVAAYFIMESAWSKRFGFSDTFCWWVSTVSGELRHHSHNWLHMLYLASNFFCADPRDIIYSLRGMIDLKEGSELLHPNYNANVLDVYRNSVEAAFVNFKNTDVLLYASQQDVPSWIPMWNRAMLFRNPFRFGNPLPWKPSKNNLPSWSIDRTSNTLTLAGIVVDVIQAVEPHNEGYFGNTMLGSESDRLKLKESWYAILSMIYNVIGILPLPDEIIRAIALVSCFGLDETSHPGDEARLLRNFVAYLRNIVDIELCQSYVSKALREDAAAGEGHLFGKPVWDFEYPESTIFVTKNRRIGCSTGKNKPEDVVFIPYGCTYPLILRPADGSFLIRGFAWVSGIMHGEKSMSEGTLLKIR